MTTRTRIITITYSTGHQRSEIWEQETLVCPLCGNAAMWSCAAHDDYYQGRPYLCLDCGSLHYIDTIPDADRGGYGESLAKLRQDTVP